MAILEVAGKPRKKTVNDTELSILGISTEKAPSLTSFPKHFNPEGFQIWTELLNSDWYATLKAKGGSTTDMWFAVIKTYMKGCATDGMFPFNQSTQQSNNDVAMSFLNSSRIRIKKFFDEIELFTKLKIQTVERRYEFQPHSFTVINVAVMKPLEDPTLEKWLTKLPLPRFTYEGLGVYKKTLQANIDLKVEISNRRRVTVTYSIFCHTPLAIPDYNRIPSRARLTQFAEKMIWLPVIRAHRFANIGGRLF